MVGSGGMLGESLRATVGGRLRRTGLRIDLVIVLTLLVLPVLFFWQVTIGGKTLLPADNIFVWAPWDRYASEAGVGVPHNGLLSDLYLENYVWKRFIVESLKARQLPLWNPYILTGVPFLAAGQHSAMYPLSVLFYVMPIPLAYGWFAAAHLFLAGLFAYLLARTLRIGRVGSVLSALTFMFGGFMVIRNVFPMIVAAAVWLPLILVAIERIASRAERGETALVGYIPEAVLGAASFGMAYLAGHPEMYYYVTLAAGGFSLWRLLGIWWRTRRYPTALGASVALLCMLLLGLGLGAAQWVPMLELVRANFRQTSASFKEVLGWAYPVRRVISFLIPDFFGNPVHHSYFDLFSWQRLPVTVNALGQPIDTIYWGIKNYVEGASYIGVLPVLLCLIAVLRRKGRHVGFFIVLGFLSLLFIFGSPLYWFVYKLPGLEQVHSPFRWVYHFSLCASILAGMGADALWSSDRTRRRSVGWRPTAAWLADVFLPWASLGAGVAILGALAASLLAKERIASLGERIMRRLALAPQAYADGRMFFSHQFRNMLVFGIALAFGGLVLLLRRRLRRHNTWGALAAIVVVAELFIIGQPFFPATDRSLVGYRTPAIDFLERDPDLFRITSYVGGSEKTLNANAAMFYDIEDVRGYDSIIPLQYAEYMGLVQEQSELQYNRIAPIFDRSSAALDSPLLDMLNAKYVLTNEHREIGNQGYTLVYDDEIRIYRNDDAVPRAFLVPQAISIPDASARREYLRSFDPREIVVLEETIDFRRSDDSTRSFSGQVEAIEHTPNEVTVSVDTRDPCFLVLADSYFPGWLAFIRPAGADDPGLAEKRLHIYRANGNFRAVEIPPGRHVVRFKYSPDLVKFGLYISFVSGSVLLLGLGLWGWLRFYRGAHESVAVQRVTKNTVAPIILNLVNKVIDMAFAMLMLRILGPADAGQYYLAVVVISWFDILTNFGLSTLVTREVARDREQANRYLSNSMASHVALWVVSVPILAAFFASRQFTKPLDGTTIAAITLFGIGLLPSSLSASFAAVFNARERMEIPAAVAIFTTLLKVSLGTLALLLRGGYVGLAGVSIVVNLITVIVFYVLTRMVLFRPRLELDVRFQKRMLADSYPLMINLLLATLFFKVAVLLLEWLVRDARVLGWYSTAYKYIDAVQLIPAYFTLAIFPMMSRFATTARGSLIRAYQLAIKLLVIVAIPIAMAGSVYATELVTVLGGSQYLPHAAGVLRVMIWYMPFGFINSVTQYVLIAVDQQRFLTRAFAVGLVFSVLANLIFITRYGYLAAAYVAIASELALLIPFYIGVRRHLAHVSFVRLSWKQAVSAMPMALMFVILTSHRALSLSVGILAYAGGLVLLQVFDRDEMQVVLRALPIRRVTAWVAQLWRQAIDVAMPQR